MTARDGTTPTNGAVRSYYGRPVVKPHVWTPLVPLYFWIGGAAGASAVHTIALRIAGNASAAQRQKYVALAGAAVAPLLLTLDLGVPQRFLNMLRVFKPTSPMSVGSWALTAFGSALGVSTAADIVGIAPASRAFEVLAGVLGPVVSTYTAVLIADTATPIWHEARTELPFVFISSSLAGAGALGSVFAPHDEAESARRMLIAGAVATVAVTKVMETRLGPLLSEPYHRGTSRRLGAATSICTVAGAALALFARRSRGLRALAAALVVTGGICERYMIFAGGKASAKDPRYVIEPQRARVDEGARAHGPAG